MVNYAQYNWQFNFYNIKSKDKYVQYMLRVPID